HPPVSRNRSLEGGGADRGSRHAVLAGSHPRTGEQRKGSTRMTENRLDQPPAETPASAKPSRRWIFVLIAAVVFGVGAYPFWSPNGGPAAGAAPQPAATSGGPPAGAHGAPGGTRVVPVVAEPARTGDIRVYLDGLGAVTPLATVTVRSRVDGQL